MTQLKLFRSPIYLNYQLNIYFILFNKESKKIYNVDNILNIVCAVI